MCICKHFGNETVRGLGCEKPCRVVKECEKVRECEVVSECEVVREF